MRPYAAQPRSSGLRAERSPRWTAPRGKPIRGGCAAIHPIVAGTRRSTSEHCSSQSSSHVFRRTCGYAYAPVERLALGSALMILRQTSHREVATASVVCEYRSSF